MMSLLIRIGHFLDEFIANIRQLDVFFRLVLHSFLKGSTLHLGLLDHCLQLGNLALPTFPETPEPIVCPAISVSHDVSTL